MKPTPSRKSVRATSVTIAMYEDIVGEAQRDQCRARGHWAWVAGLRAERWGNVHVTARPRE